MLEWENHNNYPMIVAKSPAGKGGMFRIFYDDIMYWDSFSGMSPTQDITVLKTKAQEIHDSYK